jgi:hypothetical protein
LVDPEEASSHVGPLLSTGHLVDSVQTIESVVTNRGHFYAYHSFVCFSTHTALEPVTFHTIFCFHGLTYLFMLIK